MAINQIVEVSGETKANEGAAPLPFTMKLDFSKCSPEEIMDLAADGIVVKLQGRARSAFKAKSNMAKDGKTPINAFAHFAKAHLAGVVDIKTAIVDARRTPGKSDLEKATELLGKLDPEARKALLASLASKK